MQNKFFFPVQNKEVLGVCIFAYLIKQGRVNSNNFIVKTHGENLSLYWAIISIKLWFIADVMSFLSVVIVAEEIKFNQKQTSVN